MDGCQHSDIVEDPEKADKMARLVAIAGRQRPTMIAMVFGVHGNSRAGFADIDA